MKKLIVLLIASLAFAQQIRIPGPGGQFPAGGAGTCCTVGAAISNTSFTPPTVVVPSAGTTNRAAGNGIFCIATQDGFSGTMTFTNIAGDTWIPLDTWDDGSMFQRFATAYVKSSIGSAVDVITVTDSTGFTQLAASCIDFTGQNASTPLDTHAIGFTSGSGTSVTSASFTTASPKELIIGGTGTYAGSAWTAGLIGGVTATIPSGASAPFNFASLEYLLVTTTQSSITAAASIASSSPAMGIGVATFK